jgi:isoleucyl-tRNA synthetase
LHTVLEVLCRVVAPLLPFLAEEVWRPLTGERSVHLATWPSPNELPADTELVASMDLVREICSAAHSIRKASGLRARLPLRSLTFAAPGAGRLSGLTELIKDEVNVKEVRFLDDVASVSNERLSLVPAKLGPRLGSRTQEAIVAVRSGTWHRDEDGSIVAGGIALLEGEYELLAVAADEHSARVLANAAGVVVLDREADEELEAEGTARDIVRSVQEERKKTGLRISDRIRLTLALSDEVAATVQGHLEWVAAQTLALEIEVIPMNGATLAHELSDGTPIGIYLSAL